MKFEYSLVKSLFRQFSVGFTYFRSVSCFVKLDPNFSICITLLQTIINVYYVYTTVKGITKTDILCAVIEHNAHTVRCRKNMQTCFKLDEGGKKQNKKYTTYLAFTALATLERMDVREIGRSCWLISCTGVDFGIGTTLASFQLLGSFLKKRNTIHLNCLTLLALNIDPSKLYHILWVPNRLKKC